MLFYTKNEDFRYELNTRFVCVYSKALNFKFNLNNFENNSNHEPFDDDKYTTIMATVVWGF